MKRLFTEYIILSIYTIILLPSLSYFCYFHGYCEIVHKWWFWALVCVVTLPAGVYIPFKAKFSKPLIVLWLVSLSAYMYFLIEDYV